MKNTLFNMKKINSIDILVPYLEHRFSDIQH